MSIADWSVPFVLSNTFGNLDVNVAETFVAGTGIYKLVPASCEYVVPVRFVDDPLPTASGEQLNRRFFNAVSTKLAIQLWETDDVPACDALAQDMLDTLAKWVRAYANPPDLPNSRIYWTPNGENQRMVKRVQLDDPLTTSLVEGGILQAEFSVKCPYPYAQDAAETTTALSASFTVTNTGTSEFWPVFRINSGPMAFQITNTSIVDQYGNSPTIDYSGSTWTGYLEIDTFYGTLLGNNGSGQDRSDGLVLPTSTLFQLIVGDNDITVSGATGSLLWQNAWA